MATDFPPEAADMQPGHREDIIRDAARGLELDASDELALSWLAFQPWHHVKVIASLMERLRDIDVCASHERMEQSISVTDLPGMAGNSGPGY